MKVGTIVLFLLLLTAPFVAVADAEISEIMYDIEGSDSKHEWIEVHNTGSTDILLSEWKFYENGSNHGLSLFSGSETLSAGGFAIIADNAAIFSSDWPSVTASIFDSVFSLSNVGETLIIRDEVLNDIDSASYTSELGAAGDGNSLQKNGGTFTPAAPTPGGANSSSPLPSETESGEAGEPDSGSSTTPSSVVEIKRISIEISAPRTVLVGADALFSTESFGTEGEPLENERVIWNFGDGEVREGAKVFKNFYFPGEYVVVASVSSGQYTAADSTRVIAKPSDLLISNVVSGPRGFIELSNRSRDELDISLWHILSNKKKFSFPVGTKILPGKKVSFANRITGLSPISIASTKLLYPNGVEAYVQIAVPNTPTRKVSVPRQSEPVVPAVVSTIQEIVEKDEEADVDIALSTEQSAGAVILSDGGEGSGIGTWILALGALLGAAIIGFLLVRMSKEKVPVKDELDKSNIKKMADEYDTIE